MHSSFFCAVLSLTLIHLAHAQTGVSYCTSGVCSHDEPCDLGICCSINMTQIGPGETGTCLKVSDLPSHETGAECDISNPCMRCPDGESCLGGYCLKLQPMECKLEYGCSCNEDSECSTNYCATDGKCRHLGLVYNDICVDDEQCSSGHCSMGTCVGLPIGSPCSNDYSNPCVSGARCLPNKDGFACTLKMRHGEGCTSTSDCDYYNAACIDGICANALSLDEGERCKSSYYCKVGLMCVDNICQGPPSGNCVTSSCPSTFSCECNGTSGTACLRIKNACHDEYGEFLSCMRRNNCSRLYAPGMNYFTDDLCSYRCLNEAIATFCCSDCGGASMNTITNPPYFLNCETTIFDYQPSCGTCSPPPPSVCTTSTVEPQQTADSGTQSEAQTDTSNETSGAETSESHSETQTETETSEMGPPDSSSAALGTFLPVVVVVLISCLF